MAKTAIITGASRGIGKAIALKLASSGYNIVVNYNSSEQVALDVCNECMKFNIKAIAIKCDVSNFSEVENMFKQTLETFDTIDVLVNNSGITKDTLVLRMSEEDFSNVIDTNLKGTFNTIKVASKIMFKQRSGNIINMSSVIGQIGNIGQANYAASKGGVIALTKSIAKEFASRNIRCNAIAPGFINTEMTEVLNEDIKTNILKNIPLNSFGSVEDVANCVDFLISDNAKYITGQIINIDGGMVM